MENAIAYSLSRDIRANRNIKLASLVPNPEIEIGRKDKILATEINTAMVR